MSGLTFLWYISSIIKERMNTLIDKSTLVDYATNFYGYGDLNNPVWIIGLEEGEAAKDHTLQMAHKRINTALQLMSGNNTTCVRESHKISHPEFYQKSFIEGSLKSEYARNVCRILSAYEGQLEPSTDDVRDYLLNGFGIRSTLLEFRPLASTRLNVWKWNNWVNMEELKDRNTYYKWIDPIRKAWFSKNVKKYNPKVVIGFGADIKRQWNDIFGFEFNEDNKITYLNKGKEMNVYTNFINGTLYVNAPSPNYRGASKEYYNWLGKLLNELTQ